MRLGIDVDEVVCELHPAWAAEYNRSGKGKQIQAHQIRHIVLDRKWPGIMGPDILGSHLYDQDMVDVMPGAVNVMEQLRKMGHEITFVTKCGRGNHMAAAKFSWLLRTRLFREGDLYRPASNKANAPVDLLLDDSPKNVRTFSGIGVLLRRPHNEGEYGGLYTVETLQDFVRFMRCRRDRDNIYAPALDT